MTSTINASTTAGIVTTADTSGVLALQTAGTTALSISAAQVVTLTNALPVASGGSGVTTSTGTGANVLGTTPSFTSTIGVGGATASASGSGISFPATQSASSDANTLDDYEEGTWTPSVGGTATYTIQVGTYTKIGRLVTAFFDMNINTIGTGTTSGFSGLPFTSTNGGGDGMGGAVGYFASTATSIVSAYLRVDRSTTSPFIWSMAAAGTFISNNAFFGNSTRLTGTLTYITAT